ncbi:MAG: GDSL-type esterase/lipase family protein [Mucilaginibacter sp.]
MLRNIFRICVFLVVPYLSASGEQHSIKVACAGNSVTFGFGIADRETNCYPAQLQSMLGKGYAVANFGHSGATLLRKGHNPYAKTAEFTKLIQYRADIVIIDLGLNDTDPRDWPNYGLGLRSDYAWLIDTLRKSNPQMQVYICLLTPIFSGHPRFLSGTRDWFWDIQRLLPSIAQANHAGLIDLHTPLYDRPDLFADNIHPDKEGAGIIARTIYQRITGNFGGLKPDNLFASHAVLQRGKPIPVYGQSNAGTRITVSFAGHTLYTTTDVNGKWKVVFPAKPAGGPYMLKISDGQSLVNYSDILMGDVWLCSGQSNMAFPLSRSTNGRQEMANSGSYSSLRLYHLAPIAETDPVAWDSVTLRKVNQLQYFTGSWKECNEQSSADFSAVAYYFGRQLTEKEHVPIGLIEVAVGGSPAASWVDRYTMEHDDLLVNMLSGWRSSDFMMKWCRDRTDTNLSHAASPRQRHPYKPCYNFEAGISHLTSFPIKGVVWYQGESDAHNAELYAHLFKTIVNSWREQWGYKFPFYFAQLSGIDRPSWPLLRDTQRKLATELPNSAMAVTMDMGDSLNVHYPNKKPIGERLALLAEKYTYKRAVCAQGPQILFAQDDGKIITLHFAGNPVLKTTNHLTLTGFELVTDKGMRIPAKAYIKGRGAIIEHKDGLNISALYYAMQPFTHANLAGRTGLPASTFILHRHRDIFY